MKLLCEQNVDIGIALQHFFLNLEKVIKMKRLTLLPLTAVQNTLLESKTCTAAVRGEKLLPLGCLPGRIAICPGLVAILIYLLFKKTFMFNIYTAYLNVNQCFYRKTCASDSSAKPSHLGFMFQSKETVCRSIVQSLLEEQ